jgi:acetyl-CoA acetyltransferase
MPSNAYIIGSYSTQFKKWPEKSFRDLTRDACMGVLEDAGMDAGDEVEYVWFGHTGTGGWGPVGYFGQICLLPLVQEGVLPKSVPIANVENACATGSQALHGAWKDILSGQTHLSMAVGVEKVFNPNLSKEAVLKTFSGGDIKPDETREAYGTELMQAYAEAAEMAGIEFKPGGDRTLWMDTYAMQAQLHMLKHGTTQRQIAVGASKNHWYGARNPKAQYQFEVPLEDVLTDRMVSPPLTRSMCAPIGDGAASALLCSEEFLANAPSKVQDRAVRVAASAFSSATSRAIDEPSLSKVAADRAYQQAGVGPDDIDVAEVHDATSFCEVYQSEMMGFCEIGQGGPFVGSGATGPDGTVPTNTSGGLVSKGHPIAATGLSMIYELVTQLRGEAGERQVKGAELALQENGGGVIGLEEAACSVIILAKDR